MHPSVLMVLVALVFTLPSVYGGNILVFPVDGSHWVNMKVLIEELHSRGHNITVVRAETSWYIKEKSPHYTSITIPESGGFDEEFFGSFVSELLQIKRENRPFWSRLRLEWQVTVQFSEFHRLACLMMTAMFEDAELMRSLRDAKYDVVLADPAIGGGPILARYLSVPLVLNVRWTLQGEAHYALAPSPLSYVPFPALELTDKMTFAQRAMNVLGYYFGAAQMLYVTAPHYTEFTRRYFGPDVDFFSFTQDADIWLMRNDFVFEFPRPTMPNFVYISGFQCKPSKPLPKNLEDFVQSSGEHGVIIMSLGTLIGQLPHDITEDIAAAFAQLPQKVIWRYTGPRPMTLGNNTLLVDWMPQNDLLGHPQTRAFVAHGGTNGIQEAIFHGVPIVGLPLVFDQPDNLSRMRGRGAAKIVEIATVDRNSFLEAVKEVVYEPSYRTNMQRLSRLQRDQPMRPLDQAIFWVEYVIRNKGAAHLRTQSYKMSWVAYNSVDVIATLLAVVFFITLVSYYFIRLLCCRVCGKRKVKKE